MGIPLLENIFPKNGNDSTAKNKNNNDDDDDDTSSLLDPEFPPFLCVFTVCVALLLRIAVGYQPHSGQDNHHGSSVAYGGDYEAQRHWLELTWHLPVGDWYWYDLEYWGLDYPPLTAYVSYLCGGLSHYLVGPHTVALETSRGYENDPTHKAFMRATVYILDALIYFPAIYYCFQALWRHRKADSSSTSGGVESFDYDFMRSVWIALVQPAILLIDHGHFQYNTVALGLSLWACYHMTKSSDNFGVTSGVVVGSICYCLALNFKQMTLYYAPVIFSYLLGRCFRRCQDAAISSTPSTRVAQRFIILGITVIMTFGLLWWPFLLNGPSVEDENTSATSTTTLDLVVSRGQHVLRRIFPFQRGLFEGKVANLWCALDTKPVNIRDRIPVELQPIAALLVTVGLMLPSCIQLFRVGKKTATAPSNAAMMPSSQTSAILQHSSDLKALLWGMTSSALAFFLASFQVHEKSLLLALAPASLLCWEDNVFIFSDWFSIVTAWTLWPLMVVDRLSTAYMCTILFFNVSCLQLRRDRRIDKSSNSMTRWELVWGIVTKLSYVGMIGLHIAEWTLPVPPQYPDLFPVLWSIGGCILCYLAWLRTIVFLIFQLPGSITSSKEDETEKKKVE